jgi:hypothetical protein
MNLNAVRTTKTKNMKVSKTLLAGLMCAGILGSARADVTVYITGSTAFRSSVNNSINALFGVAAPTVTYGNSTPNKANEALWIGTMPSRSVNGTNTTAISGTVTIKAHWSGSVEGIRDVSQGNLIPFFINSSQPAGNYPTINFADPTSYTATNFEAAPGHAADIAMADCFQGSTKYTATHLTDNQVGVVTFVWAKNAGAPATLTNITAALARSLLAGPINLSLFTGNSNDTKLVFAVGRYDGSGTRVQGFADSGFGIFSTPEQFGITNVAGAAQIALFSGVDANGVNHTDGSQGYFSGGQVSTAMSVPGSSTTIDPFGNTGWYAICYVGISDNANINGGANALSLNGVPYSTAAVQEGEYSYWGYEHLLYLPALAGDKLTFAHNVTIEIVQGLNSVASGVDINSMHVSKASDTADAAHN